MNYMNQKPLYLSVEDYKAVYLDNNSAIPIPEQSIESELRRAQRNIDILTFNRIVSIGFDKLSDFQKGVIQTCMLDLANFQYENKELLESVVGRYEINGVSLSLDEESSPRLKSVNGVLITNEFYQYLMTTGLCCRRI